MDCRAAVQWEDIAGQDDAKRLVQELVVWPMLNPHLFRVGPLSTRGVRLSRMVILIYWRSCSSGGFNR